MPARLPILAWSMRAAVALVLLASPAEARQAVERFFADVAAWKQGHQGGTGRVRQPDIVADGLSGELTGTVLTTAPS